MAKIQNDNTTPMSAKVYDVKISKTIPYFSAVHVFWISYMQMGVYAIK